MPPKKRQERDDAQAVDKIQEDKAKKQKISFLQVKSTLTQPTSFIGDGSTAGTSLPNRISSGARSAALSSKLFTTQDQPRFDSTSRQSAWTNQHSSRAQDTETSLPNRTSSGARSAPFSQDTWNERPSSQGIPRHHQKILQGMTANMSTEFTSTKSSGPKVVGILDYTSLDGRENTLIGFSGRNTKFSQDDPGRFLHQKLDENISKWNSEDKERRYFFIPDISLVAQTKIEKLKEDNGATPGKFCAEDKLGSEILKLKTLEGRIDPKIPLTANYYEISPNGKYNRVGSCKNCNKTREKYSNMTNPLTNSPSRSIPKQPTQDASEPRAVSPSRARAVYTSSFPGGNSTSPQSSHLNQDSPHEPGTKPGRSFSR